MDFFYSRIEKNPTNADKILKHIFAQLLFSFHCLYSFHCLHCLYTAAATAAADYQTEANKKCIHTESHKKSKKMQSRRSTVQGRVQSINAVPIECYHTASPQFKLLRLLSELESAMWISTRYRQASKQASNIIAKSIASNAPADSSRHDPSSTMNCSSAGGLPDREALVS